MAGEKTTDSPVADAVNLAVPFAGQWLARNSPARRIPSHGTWPPNRFLGFGLDILAPAAGVVVAVHDGEPDHQARWRCQLPLLPYAVGQTRRLRQGVAAIAGRRVRGGAA